MALGLAGALLVFSGLWHCFEWLMGGRNKDTLRLIPFGLAYAILGYLIVNVTGGQAIPWIALLLTCLGITGAFVTKDSADVRKWVTWSFILLDIVIILALLIALFF